MQEAGEKERSEKAEAKTLELWRLAEKLACRVYLLEVSK
jgi:hypothetical protein